MSIVMPRVDLYTVLRRLGLTTGLQACYDAGHESSYSGSGQTWNDLTGNGNHLYLGPDGSATAADPTFSGTAGRRSVAENFSVDGADYFRLSVANPTWLNNIHKDNAVFTFLYWIYQTGFTGTDAHLGNNRGSLSRNGFRIRTSATTGDLNFQVSKGSGGLAIDLDMAGTNMTANQWTMVGISLDESIGANGAFSFMNGVSALHTSTYTTPTASDSGDTFEVFAGGNGTSLLDSGSMIRELALYSGARLQLDQMMAIWHLRRTLYGV